MGNEYSKFGKFSHIEFFSASHVAESIFNIKNLEHIKVKTLNSSFTLNNGYLKDLKFSNQIPSQFHRNNVNAATEPQTTATTTVSSVVTAQSGQQQGGQEQQRGQQQGGQQQGGHQLANGDGTAASIIGKNIILQLVTKCCSQYYRILTIYLFTFVCRKRHFLCFRD